MDRDNSFSCICLLSIFAGFNTLLKATDIVKVWIFPSTPAYQITILLLLPFIILTLSGLRALTSYSMLVFFFTTWMPLFLLFSLKTNYNPLHLLPIFKEGLYPIVKATKETITPYAGLEIAYYIYPFLQKAKSHKRTTNSEYWNHVFLSICYYSFLYIL